MSTGRVHARPHGLMDVLRRGNLGALVLPLFLLAAGAVARGRLARKTVPFTWRGIQLAHPVGWTIAERSADPTAGDSVVLIDLLGPGRIKPRVTMQIGPTPAEPEAPPTTAAGSADAETSPAPAPPAGIDAAAPATAAMEVTPLTAALSNRLPLYFVMGEQPIRVGDLPATRVDSAFAFTPRALPGRKAVPGRKGDIPVVMRAIDVVLLRGSEALSVQVAAPIEDFETQRPTLEAIIASLKVDSAAMPAVDGAPAGPAPQAEEVAPGQAGMDVPPGTAAGAGADGAVAVAVAGQVVDAESGLPVPGAIIVFLAPGTAVDDVNDDNLTQIAYTTGLADSTGRFASNRALRRPGRYGVIVVADGYRWIGVDEGVSVDAGSPPSVDLGQIPLRRR